MRVGLAGVAAVTFVVFTVGFAGVAGADDPTGGWTDPAPQGVSGESVSVGYLVKNQKLAGVADHSAGIDNVSFVLVEDGAPSTSDPCSASKTAANTAFPVGGASHAAFSFDVRFPCNRRYVVRATVNPRRPLTHGPSNPTNLDLRVVVAIPPPDVADLTAEGTDDGGRAAVHLEWPDVNPKPADLQGYEVRRTDESGGLDPVVTVDADQSSFTDETVTPGASYGYEVVAVRPGPEANTVVYSKTPMPVEVTVPVSTTSTTATPNASSVRGPSTTSRRTPGSMPIVPVPIVTVPRAPTTVDTGFQERLPFKVPPTTALADGSAVARLEGDESNGDRQTLALIAGGLAAMVGAGLLRFLAAAAMD